MKRFINFLILAPLFFLPAFDEDPAERVLGCWQSVEKGKDWMLRFEPLRRIQYLEGRLEAVPVDRYEKGAVILSPYGKAEEVKLSLEEDVLTLKSAKLTSRFKRMDKVPPELELKPLVLGDSKSPPEAIIMMIQEELRIRAKADQAVRKVDPIDHDAMQNVDKDNTAWLKKTVMEFGWIDADRFGVSSASAAFLIVQHSMDLPLMMAALPWIEKDVKAEKIGPQPYALLFDRIQIRLGKRQRYGTQLASNDQGEPLVLPLQDRDQVDEFRKEIGLFPLAEYLKVFEKITGKKAKFTEEGPPEGK